MSSSVYTKGIVLAGGSGTRLYPLTSLFSKQLQPIYDKPMIYYPLATLMLVGIRDILIISTPFDTPNFERLLGNGARWGINIQYAVQPEPKGIAQAFLYGQEFIGSNQVCLILGDNLFYGNLSFLRRALQTNVGGTIFGYPVNDPERYGVVEFGADNRVLSIEEKPKKPKSNYAVPGLYVYTHDVCEIASQLQPSARGELEITDVNMAYLRQNRLRVELMGRGLAWLDTGTPKSLLEASMFIHTIEERQGYKIACLEEIALQQGFLSAEDWLTNVEHLPKSPYREYCLRIYEEWRSSHVA
ncbi:MAG: glucose-1-phosphate thymidylyltransferase RfbA [Bacteroidota bacterium]|nr:glucose-1-phosphate thymidylyltransferase RfbA [Candidatus Kapabacteria bacterium]MDW8221201.1 glucose-1-phosphate thymidylyltransferase RfbA [Bacteroidota bacterium]